MIPTKKEIRSFMRGLQGRLCDLSAAEELFIFMNHRCDHEARTYLTCLMVMGSSHHSPLWDQLAKEAKDDDGHG